MKVHPETVAMMASRQRKLQRAPRIFPKMLELPLRADADVYTEENPSMLRFFAAADGVCSGVRAQMLVVHPWLTKVVVLADGESVSERHYGEVFDLDSRKIRLPWSTQPALATAVYVDGVIVVTVPKGDGS